jgi:hypothetical protein
MFCEESSISPIAPHPFITSSRYRHGAIDIACMQRWTMAEIKQAFGDGAFEYCTTNYGEVQRPTKPYTFTDPGTVLVAGCRLSVRAAQECD